MKTFREMLNESEDFVEGSKEMMEELYKSNEKIVEKKWKEFINLAPKEYKLLWEKRGLYLQFNLRKTHEQVIMECRIYPLLNGKVACLKVTGFP